MSNITITHMRAVCLVFTMAALLFAGCQSDLADHVEDSRRSTLQLMPYASTMVDVQQWNGTRAGSLPTGYVTYNTLFPTTAPANNTIGIFMTPENTTSMGSVTYQGVTDGENIWSSSVAVTKDTQYYIYGFMPREDVGNATIAMLDGATDYSAGAVLTITGFNTLTPGDVCTVVGVRKATATETMNNLASDVTLGRFDYLGGAKDDNRVFVLMKHIYAGLRFKTHIDAEYHNLRTVKVTNMTLTAENIYDKTDIALTLTANNDGTDPLTSVTYSQSASSTASDYTITLFPPAGSDATSFEVPVTTPEDFMGCFAPGSCRTFVLRTTYDVYDSHDNLIRKGCVADNKINESLISGLTNLRAGHIYSIDLLIKPTYLYVLSNPDLDNPTITLSSN